MMCEFQLNGKPDGIPSASRVRIPTDILPNVDIKHNAFDQVMLYTFWVENLHRSDRLPECHFLDG